MALHLQSLFVAFALFVLAGCEAKQAAEIPQHPAPPPTSQPRVLEEAKQTVRGDTLPTKEQE